MLETIREFGIDRLAERGETDAVRAAHARYFAAVAAATVVELQDHRQRRALDTLADEHENILAGLRHLCAIGDAPAATQIVVDLNQYWAMTGRHTEAVTWLDLVLALPADNVDPDLRLTAIAMRVVNLVASMQVGPPDLEGVDPREAILPWLDQVVAMDATQQPMIAVVKPVLLWFSNDLERLPRYLDEAISHADPWVRATGLSLRARFSENQGDVDLVRADVDAAIGSSLSRGRGDGLLPAVEGGTVLAAVKAVALWVACGQP